MELRALLGASMEHKCSHCEILPLDRTQKKSRLLAYFLWAKLLLSTLLYLHFFSLNLFCELSVAGLFHYLLYKKGEEGFHL